jgi:hypothetical protein
MMNQPNEPEQASLNQPPRALLDRLKRKKKRKDPKGLLEKTKQKPTKKL